MRLSEAMMLGGTTCRMEAGDWNSCALGCAGNAIGIAPGRPKEIGYYDNVMLTRYTMPDMRSRREHITDRWPWIDEMHSDATAFHVRVKYVTSIYIRFDELVCRDKMTFEQLVDYVRSIEPDCGECNQFQCTCVQKMDETSDVPAYTEA